MMKEMIVATLIFIGGVFVVLAFMPGSLTRDGETVKVVGMCDSVFVNENDEIQFSIRNKSDELFYIDRTLHANEILMLKKKCSGEVITLVFCEPGLIANAIRSSHRVTRVDLNERTIYSAAIAHGITLR
jgi:hypothetical protein